MTHTKAEFIFKTSRIKTRHIFLSIRRASKGCWFWMHAYHRGSFINQKSITHDDIPIFQKIHRNENGGDDTEQLELYIVLFSKTNP